MVVEHSLGHGAGLPRIGDTFAFRSNTRTRARLAMKSARHSHIHIHIKSISVSISISMPGQDNRQQITQQTRDRSKHSRQQGTTTCTAFTSASPKKPPSINETTAHARHAVSQSQTRWRSWAERASHRANIGMSDSLSGMSIGVALFYIVGTGEGVVAGEFVNSVVKTTEHVALAVHQPCSNRREIGYHALSSDRELGDETRGAGCV